MKLSKKTILSIAVYFSALCFSFNSNSTEHENEIGFSFGTPGGINFVVQIPTAKTDLKFSGMKGIGRNNEGHGFEIGATIYRNPYSYFRSVQVVVGTIELDNVDQDEFDYIGVSTTVRHGSFFIEPGLAMGQGDFSNPQLLVQLGWLF